MKIRYELTIEDLVAFNRSHFDNSPVARRGRVRSMIIIGLLLVGMIVYAATTSKPIHPILFFVPLTFLAMLLFLPAIGRRQIERQVRQLYADGTNKGPVGWHELELTGSELISRDSAGETRAALQSIQEVVTRDEFTFIYLDAVSAHVIPHKAVSQGNIEGFIAVLNKKVGPKQEEAENT